MVVDRRVCMAQKELLSRKVAKSVSRCMGAFVAIQPTTKFQDESRGSDGTSRRLV